jgi:hypothetical protein
MYIRYLLLLRQPYSGPKNFVALPDISCLHQNHTEAAPENYFGGDYTRE